MVHAPFSLRDSPIAYRDDKSAFRITQPQAAFRDAATGCMFGIAAFADDESVHADRWERHPAGDEILCVLEGRLLVVVDHHGTNECAVIEEGQAFVVPRAHWHRLQVVEPGRLLFLTPPAGTTLRPHAGEEGGQDGAAATRTALPHGPGGGALKFREEDPS